MVEAHVVDVLGPQPGLRESLVGMVPDRRQHLVREELAELLDLLRVVGSLDWSLGDGRLVRERPELPVEVLELHDLEPVDDVHVGVGPLRGTPEGELQGVAGRCDVDGANAPDPVLRRREASAELSGRLANRRRPIASRPRLVGLIELVKRLETDLLDLDLRNLNDSHRALLLGISATQPTLESHPRSRRRVRAKRGWVGQRPTANAAMDGFRRLYRRNPSIVDTGRLGPPHLPL